MIYSNIELIGHESLYHTVIQQENCQCWGIMPEKYPRATQSPRHAVRMTSRDSAGKRKKILKQNCYSNIMEQPF